MLKHYKGMCFQLESTVGLEQPTHWNSCQLSCNCDRCLWYHHLHGLVVKVSCLVCWRSKVQILSSYLWLKTGNSRGCPAWRSMVSAATGRPVVSNLWFCEITSLVCNFCCRGSTSNCSADIEGSRPEWCISTIYYAWEYILLVGNPCLCSWDIVCLSIGCWTTNKQTCIWSKVHSLLSWEYPLDQHVWQGLF